MEQVYRPDFVSPKAGNHSSRPIIAYGLEPSTRMLGRAALWGEPRACLFDVAPDRGYRVSPCIVIVENQLSSTEMAVPVHI